MRGFRLPRSSLSDEGRTITLVDLDENCLNEFYRKANNSRRFVRRTASALWRVSIYVRNVAVAEPSGGASGVIKREGCVEGGETLAHFASKV